jgi:hypothetical protein
MSGRGTGIAAALDRLLEVIDHERDLPASVEQAADEARYALREHRRRGADRVARLRKGTSETS